jgi:glutamate transport system substrate-binding protein
VIDGQTVMVKSDNTDIKTLADLNGKKVCTGRNSTTPANLTAKNVNATLTLLDSYPECAATLRQGRVDAVVTDRGILLGLKEQEKGGFKILNVEVSQEPLGIGVYKGDDAFRDFVNDVLEEIFQSGDWAKAYAATLGKLGLETPEPPTVNRYPGTGAATVTATTATTAAPTTTTTTTP